MLLQTNSYIVPRRLRAEHARLLVRFRQALRRVGCELFEIHEQTDANWSPTEGDGRFVQIMRFRDRAHQQAVREAERLDLEAQSLIEEFCRLINFPYQQEHGLFAVGFYAELEAEPMVPQPPHDKLCPSERVSSPDTGSVDPELTRVLDAGLELNELDIPMEAELLDEDAPDAQTDPHSTHIEISPFCDPKG